MLFKNLLNKDSINNEEEILEESTLEESSENKSKISTLIKEFSTIVNQLRHKVIKTYIKSNDHYIMDDHISDASLFLFTTDNTGYNYNFNHAIQEDDFQLITPDITFDTDFLGWNMLKKYIGRELLCDMIKEKRIIVETEDSYDFVTIGSDVEPLRKFLLSLSETEAEIIFNDSKATRELLDLLITAKVNLIMSCKVENTPVAITSEIWDKFQILCFDLLKSNRKFHNMIYIKKIIITLIEKFCRSESHDTKRNINNNHSKIMKELITKITTNEIYFTPDNLVIFVPLVRDIVNKYKLNSINLQRYIKEEQIHHNRIKYTQYSRVTQILPDKLNAIIRERKISKISKADIDESLRVFRPSKESIIKEIERMTDTKVKVIFKEPLKPYKIKYGNKHYILTDEARSEIKSSLSIKYITIDFGSINGKYPVCRVPDSKHPNINDTVCLGTIRQFSNEMNNIKGIPFPPFSELINMLSMINFDSAYRYSSTQQSIFNQSYSGKYNLHNYCNNWPSNVITKFNPSVDSYLDELLDLED